MSFSLELKESIAPFHLLNHPFYQEWMKGTLSVDTLKEYAKQYYVHVKAFPRYISATHSRCDDLEKRKLLLENLADEEGLSGTDHPELWLRFAEGLGLERSEVTKESGKEPIKNIINTFLEKGYSSYAEGLSALYSYEYQIPEIADSKIKGLKENYGVENEKTLSFFEVHKKADEFHRITCEKLIDQFSEEEKVKAKESAKAAAKSLWDFLSSLQEKSYAA